MWLFYLYHIYHMIITQFKKQTLAHAMSASLMSLKSMSGVGLSFIKGTRIPIKLLINSIID